MRGLTTVNLESAQRTQESDWKALWFVLGLVAVTAISAYNSSLSIGFLLDDFSHLDYAYRAMHGDWSDLLRVFTGNWTGAADNLTSYRPFVSLSFFIDYLVWQVNAFGYHLSNVLMFAGCSVFTALLTHELAAPLATPRIRLISGLTAGILFALYPLHPEAVAWIIGRVDVQCALFYFASLYCWLHFRRTFSAGSFVFSLLAFACALPTKEMSVTLPAAVLAAEVMLPAELMGWKQCSWTKRFALVGSFWLMLAVFAVIRTNALGTVIGGYGGGGIREFFHSLKNFLDLSTWSKVVCGVNEELPRAAFFAQAPIALLAGFTALLSLRITERLAYWRTLLFLAVWAGLAELPTFQIWHVYPNLCGSRLLFLPSAPLCAILSLVALPDFRLPIFRAPSKLATIPKLAGAIFVLCVCVLWSCALHMNLLPWRAAGVEMETLTEQVREVAADTPEGKATVLLDLPQDLCGAGMLGRPEFLEKLLRPPLDPLQQGGKIFSAEMPIPGSHDFAYPTTLSKLTSNKAVKAILKWNKAEGRYMSWCVPIGARDFAWRSDDAKPSTANQHIFWFPPTRLDSSIIQVIELEAPGLNPEFAKKVQLVWRSENQPKSWIDYTQGPTGLVDGSKIVFMPARFRSWLYQGAIVQVGLQLPPGAQAISGNMMSREAERYLPQLEAERISGGTSADKADDTASAEPRLDNADLDGDYGDKSAVLDYQKVAESTLLRIGPNEQLKLNFDCSQIPGAHHVLLMCTRNGVPFHPLALDTVPPKNNLCFQVRADEVKGSYLLPDEITHMAGVSQIAVLAMDSSDHPVGFICDPITISRQKAK